MMPGEPFIARQGDELYVEALPATQLADRFGTPLYVYSEGAIRAAWEGFAAPLAGTKHLICYAVKANSNLAVLNLFARLGAGFDIVSGGELARVLAAGGSPAKVVFSGVGKSAAEIRQALTAGIKCFNVESEPELLRIDRLARELGVVAPISVRVNPDVDAGTHAHISTGKKDNKFGINWEQVPQVYALAGSLGNVRITGIDCHIGSQILDLEPLTRSMQRILALADALAEQGIHIEHLSNGGGIGIAYRSDESAPEIGTYLGRLTLLMAASKAGRSASLLLEPGRALVGNAGVLLTRIEHIKTGPERRFAIIDAAMNDLARPAIYGAHHEIVAVRPRAEPAQRCDVVGPVCESTDVLGLARELAAGEGDLLAILSAGAYGMSMASNYNTRTRPAEVLVRGCAPAPHARRDEMASLWAQERIPPPLAA